ncbi:protein phosphatase 2C domain-containing protein [Microbacterium sp. SD291]|uniref:PP2C family protein-serine/threonine phosphatase n=1 Tax=Microbacterium sp. SD291 TaxID=2782007 RepID=UPI0027DAF121|nr:protein phosphatase 2C domain-containing protein [Microbacterium sp. SD291]
MRPGLIVSSGSATHPGLRRALNEDSYLASAPVFVVADGMGGHEAGERASATVIAEFARFVGRASLELDEVRLAVAQAREGVEDLSTSGNGRAGTTLSGVVVATVDGMGYWLAVNIGDSRTYRLADGELEQITVDHSVVQELIESGELSPEDAATDRRRNIITRAIGASSTGDADYWLFPAEMGDRIMICSDGLTSEIPDARIREVLQTVPDPQTAADLLITEAVDAGGRDNITVVIADAVSVASRPGTLLETDENDIDMDTRPREAAAGGAL